MADLSSYINIAAGDIKTAGNISYDGVASPAPIISGFSSGSFVDRVSVGNDVDVYPNGKFTGTNLDLQGSNSARVSAFDIGNVVDTYFQASNNLATIYVASASGDAKWEFTSNGNLTLPSNTFSVNYANGTQVSLGGNYGDSNVATLLGSFGSNGITTTGNVTVGNIIGDGQALTNITGANISGEVAFAAVANSVAVGNVTGIGNIATINLDGNTSNVLYGNGVFAGASGGSGSTIANGNSNVNIATANGDVTISSAGNSVVTITGTGANITGTTHITGNANVGNLGVATVVATANISTTGYFISGNQATGGFQLGNSNSRLKSGDSNSYMTMGQNPAIYPDTAASATAGVLFGGNGYLLGNNGSRCITLNYGGGSGVVGLNANLQVGTAGSGTVLVPGTVNTGVNSVLAGPTFTPLANTMGGFVSNVNSYTQLTIQNKSTGTDATTDFIATADNGSDTVNYLDMGIINSGYDVNTPTNSLGNIVAAADSYIYAQGNASATGQSGGNLAIGTTIQGKTVKIFAGGTTNSSIVANIANTGVTVTGNVTVSGNVVGATPNVTLVAGSYSTVLDNTGIATFPGPIKVPTLPAFRVYGSVSTAIASGNTIKSTNGTIVDYNQGSYYDNTTGIFTAPVAGLYHCFGTVRVGTNNGMNQAAIVKNGTSLSGTTTIAFWETDTNAGTASHFPLNGYAKCAVGDTLRLYVVTGNVEFDSNDNWGVTFIG